MGRYDSSDSRPSLHREEGGGQFWEDLEPRRRKLARERETIVSQGNLGIMQHDDGANLDDVRSAVDHDKELGLKQHMVDLKSMIEDHKGWTQDSSGRTSAAKPRSSRPGVSKFPGMQAK